MRLGIFGGTFNPVHNGHVRTAEEVRTSMALDRILFIPSGNPPLKSGDLADAADRFAMTALAVADNPAFDVSDIELSGHRKSYTVDTVSGLLCSCPHDHLFLILGVDAFLDMPNCYRPDKLISLIDIIVMSRHGTAPTDIAASPFLKGLVPDARSTWRLPGGRTIMHVAVAPYDISSTRIRQLVRSGRKIDHLVPAPVAEYIAAHRLYHP